MRCTRGKKKVSGQINQDDSLFGIVRIYNWQQSQHAVAFENANNKQMFSLSYP